MQTIKAILEQARHLSVDERRRLLDELAQQLQTEDAEGETKRLAALDRFIARAGIGHAESVDVASNKYQHLAGVYADERL